MAEVATGKTWEALFDENVRAPLGLPQDVGPGDVLLLDDGLMQLQVVEVQGERIISTVLNDGVLSDRKGLNKQGGGLSLGALTERDKELIGIVAKIGVDFIAVSFCRNAQDMNDARAIAESHGCYAALVSKIERTEAIENLEEIVEASDVVMVARGDLGVEIGDAELPGLQKQNKVVITATQMLQSMVESPIPTRAEVLDVANSVIDGTDAVMLSAETAAGAYPVKAVEAMARICLGAERQFQTETDFNASPRNLERADQAIAMATMFLSQHVGVRAIVAMTESGGTARYLSRFRAKAPVFAVTRHDGARRQMALMRDVFPINFDSRGLTPREAARGSIRLLVESDLLQAGDRVVFTSGEHMEKDPEDVNYNFVRWLSNGAGTAIGPSRVHPLTGQILDADIILTDGWIRHWWKQYNDVIPQLAMDGAGPEIVDFGEVIGHH
jgi:pyruvate kinase